MKKLKSAWFLSFIFLLIVGLSCVDDFDTLSTVAVVEPGYKTRKVVIVVIDGPRYVDTWGKDRQPHIPFMATKLAPQGTFFNNFRNNSYTITMPGHTAITTSHYQKMGNDGSQLPDKPSLLQHYLHQTSLPSSKACIVTSKTKLSALAKCMDPGWQDKVLPYASCGKDGKDRSDLETFEEGKKVLSVQQPDIMLIQFKGPDTNGHANNWNGYIKSLHETDSLVYELWQYLQENSNYQDQTAFLVTNDHGRHKDGHKDGFVSHGDGCDGCRHISLLALGPYTLPVHLI